MKAGAGWRNFRVPRPTRRWSDRPGGGFGAAITPANDAAIDHDILDFGVRELDTFGKGGGAIIILLLQKHLLVVDESDWLLDEYF